MILNDVDNNNLEEYKFLSIIIPVYNLENEIENCLKVLEPQLKRNEDIELFLIDDGSTDKSCDIIKKYVSENIHLIRKENGGVSSARNLGLKNAKGKFVTFIDGDDYVAENYLTIIKDKLQEEDELLCFGYYNVSENGIKPRLNLKDDTLLLNTGDGINNNLNGLFNNQFSNSVCNKIFRMDIINKTVLSFNEKKHFAEDEFFCVEYYENIRTIRTISDRLYFYVQRSGSAMHKYNNFKVDECKSCIYNYQLLSAKYNIDIACADLATYYLTMWFGLVNNASIAPTMKQGSSNVNDYLNYDFFKKNFLNINYFNLKLKHKIYYILIKFHLSFWIYLFCRVRNKFLKFIEGSV